MIPEITSVSCFLADSIAGCTAWAVPQVDEEDLHTRYRAESEARLMASARRQAAMATAAAGGALDTKALLASLTLPAAKGDHQK